jgi:integrase
MSANKEKGKTTWESQFYYTDWTGKRKKKHKRGFEKKKDALEWEREFLDKHARSMDMLFKSFLELYYEYTLNIKDNRKSSIATSKNIINTHILPFFAEKKMNEITATDIHEWQKTVKAKGYKDTYLRTIHSKLSAIFNYAVTFYDLGKNPCQAAGSMGSKKTNSIDFWTLEEFRKFIPSIADKPRAQIGIELLYWSGMRVGELCALTPADFNKEAHTINIDKTWQIVEGEEIIGPPKSNNGVRVVIMPEAICKKLEKYIDMLYECPVDERIFEGASKYFFASEIKRGSLKTGIKRIRVHDLRHSHVALLIDLGYNDYMIAERIGDTVQEVQKTYAHLYPNKNKEIALHLEALQI